MSVPNALEALDRIVGRMVFSGDPAGAEAFDALKTIQAALRPAPSAPAASPETEAEPRRANIVAYYCDRCEADHWQGDRLFYTHERMHRKNGRIISVPLAEMSTDSKFEGVRPAASPEPSVTPITDEDVVRGMKVFTDTPSLDWRIALRRVLEDFASRRAPVQRATSGFTQIDIGFLRQWARDEVDGIHKFPNQHAADYFTDLANRIEATLAASKSPPTIKALAVHLEGDKVLVSTPYGTVWMPAYELPHIEVAASDSQIDTEPK